MNSSRRPARSRIILMLALAYALVLQGLLGALGVGAQASEARLAAQLGVICTIHGVVDPQTGEGDSGDPTPGKLACIEHCMPVTGQLPLPVPAAVPGALVEPKLIGSVTPPAAPVVPAFPRAAPPPPRGPPSF